MTTELRDSREPLKVHDSDLSGSHFSDTKMEKSGFDDVNLRAASFTDCNLSDAVFVDVNLANASIENANIDGLKINGVPVSARMAAASGKPGAVVFAKDIDRMARFYEHAASMAIVHADAECIVLESMHFQLTLHAIPERIADAIHVADPPAPRTNAAMKLCLPVPEIAETRAQALAFGGCVNPPADEWDGGGFRACDGHDPEGNVIQLRESASAGGEQSAQRGDDRHYSRAP